MYTAKAPYLARLLYFNRLWRIDASGKNLYLTFDDGPDPEVTTWVLSQLKKFDAKATFFCVGKNVKEHLNVYQQIISEGHQTGNHTQDHLHGWQREEKEYIENTAECKKYVSSNLFRPPYGKMKNRQSKAISKEYKIVMWDVLSGDFDTNISKEKCLQNVLQNTRKGSIIVFHDSKKAFEKLQYVLPKVLEHYAKKGFSFKGIPS